VGSTRAFPSFGKAAASRPSAISGSRWPSTARAAIALVRPRRNGLGEAFLAASQAGQASARHAAALALAIQCGDKREQARAHGGLASACQATGDNGQARNHWQALARYADPGTPEAEKARVQIAVATEGQRQPCAPSSPLDAQGRAGQIR
jgi:hypothetical protein